MPQTDARWMQLQLGAWEHDFKMRTGQQVDRIDWYDSPPPPDIVAALRNTSYAPLLVCAQAISGACGVSAGFTAISPGIALRASTDFYVDSEGGYTLYFTPGAGPAVTVLPNPMMSIGPSLIVVPNASVQDVGGFSFQLGGSVALGRGVAADLVVSLSESAPTGVAVGTAYGTWNAEAHATISYSFPIYVASER